MALTGSARAKVIADWLRILHEAAMISALQGEAAGIARQAEFIKGLNAESLEAISEVASAILGFEIPQPN